jgi:general secretion pathway protein N
MSRLAELFSGWTLILGIICLALAAVVADELWLIYRSDAEPVPVAAPPKDGLEEKAAADIPPAQEFVLPPLTAYQEIVARPLFTVSRRPPAREEDEEVLEAQERAPVQPLPKTLRLTSVVIAEGVRFALLEDTGAKKLRRVKEGQELEGWKVAEIRPERVVFEQGEARESMDLRIYNKYVPPAVKPRRPARAAKRRPGGPAAAQATAQGRTPARRAEARAAAQRRRARAARKRAADQ